MAHAVEADRLRGPAGFRYRGGKFARMARVDGFVVAAGGKQHRRGIAAHIGEAVDLFRPRPAAERGAGGIAGEGEDVVRPGEADHRVDRIVGQALVAQPAPVEPDLHHVIGAGGMAHQGDLFRIAAMLRYVAIGPRDGGSGIFQHRGIFAAGHQPVAGDDRDIALRCKIPPDERVIGRVARVPAAAMDPDHHRAQAVRFAGRFPDIEALAVRLAQPDRPGSKRRVAGGEEAVDPVERGDGLVRHGPAPDAEQDRGDHRQHHQRPDHRAPAFRTSLPRRLATLRCPRCHHCASSTVSTISFASLSPTSPVARRNCLPAS